MRALVGAVAALLLFAVPAEGKNCRKGCPCGNSCIPCSKTCRIGSYSPPPEPATKPRRKKARHPAAQIPTPPTPRKPTVTIHYGTLQVWPIGCPVPPEFTDTFQAESVEVAVKQGFHVADGCKK